MTDPAIFIAYQNDCYRSGVLVFLALLRLAFSANRRIEAAKAITHAIGDVDLGLDLP